MENNDINSKFCILHLREASDCIKDTYPDLSLTLLKLAKKLAYDLSISEQQIQQENEIANRIVENAS